MKKSLGLKICAGILAVPFFVLSGNALAAETCTLIVDNENICSSGKNTGQTAIFDSSTSTLTLKGYGTDKTIDSGGYIQTDLPKLNIVVESDSKIINTDSNPSIKSTGNVTISGKALTIAKGVDVSGNFTLNGAEIDLGNTDLKVTNGNILLTSGSVIARSIILNDTNSTNQETITIGDKAIVEVSKDITANYSYTTSEKGIKIGSGNCANATATVINVTPSSTTTYKVSSVISNDEKTGITKGIKFGSSFCGKKGSSKTTNPDTADGIYYYLAALVAASAVLIYRRHLAKR